jgi:hypothetical protein
LSASVSQSLRQLLAARNSSGHTKVKTSHGTTFNFMMTSSALNRFLSTEGFFLRCFLFKLLLQQRRILTAMR